MTEQIITSFLDTDLYKLTMHAAVFMNFPTARVTYKYKNRTPHMTFNASAITWLKEQIATLKDIRFTKEEIDYLRKVVPYFPEQYFQFISSSEFKLEPEKQVDLVVVPVETQSGAKGGEKFSIELTVKGLWKEVILYEIPLLALISESYFKFVDTDWSYDGQSEKIKSKARELFANHIRFSEFGTRRRRSKHAQDIVMKGLVDVLKENPTEYTQYLAGTSNVYFAMKYDLAPTGTVAHEWMMGVAAYDNDYIHANKKSMDYWISTFGPEHAGLALTDTFGSDDFLKSFYPPYSDYYTGIRQDSGDPIEFAKKFAHHYYEVLGLPKFSKIVCFSDSLNVQKAIKYDKAAHECGLRTTFGIGTNFTNDFQSLADPSHKSEPLNIVIKLASINGNPAIKISDNLGKNMGDPATVQRVKEELGYVERTWKEGDEAHRWSN